MKDIKAIIEKHTNEEGVIDYEALEEVVNGEINGIVAKNKPDTDKLKQELHGEVAKSIISGLGIEGSTVDDLKLWAKKMGGSTDEFKEANIKLEQELEKAKAELNDIATAKQELETTLTNKERLSRIKELGVKDEETAEFIKFKLDKLVGEDKDFDTALNEFKEQSPTYFRTQSVTTNRRLPNADNVINDKDADVLAAFEARQANRR
jgi:hypothetical protein